MLILSRLPSIDEVSARWCGASTFPLLGSGLTSWGPLLAAPVAGPSFAMVVLVRAGWLMSGKTMVWREECLLLGARYSTFEV